MPAYRPDLGDVVDLDAVDDDRDLDTDAATAEHDCGDDRARRAERAAVVRGAAAGAAAGAGAGVARTAIQRHPKAAFGAAILGAILVASPPDKRVQVFKTASVVVTVCAALVAVLVLAVMLAGVYGADGSGGTTTTVPRSTQVAPTPAASHVAPTTPAAPESPYHEWCAAKEVFGAIC